jgi:sarcosine oxidase, subunit alpha
MSGSLRMLPLTSAEHFRFDDEEIAFAPGDSVAAALVAAGHRGLTRSLKYHRRRGPSCLRGACDGCLVRIDGQPNQLACKIHARPGMVVLSQNTLGSREFDLLRVTDWFFPEGMNHHELLAGVPGLSSLMQGFARRVAGLGTLPDRIAAPQRSERTQIGALVVGSGAAGTSIAVALAARGHRVVVVEEDLEAHATLRCGGIADTTGATGLLREFAQLSHLIEVRVQTSAAALFGPDVLLVGPAGAEVCTANVLVLAVGAQDGVLAFPGNDLPGIYSARAACLLLARGIRPGRHPLVVHVSGDGLHAQSAATQVGKRPLLAKIIEARGMDAVTSVVVEDASGGRSELACDALLIDAARAPSYELPLQAGAGIELGIGGYRVTQSALGAGRFAFGEVCGPISGLAELRMHAEQMATACAAILR